MGKCINYFKTYTLKDGEIEYIGGDADSYSYNSIGNLQCVMSITGISIPECNHDEPENLKLVDPIQLIEALNKCMLLLKIEKNPIIEGDLLFCEEHELNDLDKYRSNLIILINNLIELSHEGYFISINET
ncbi:MAG: hypothetical protein ACLS2V_11755 [Clostridium paraputrificum]